MFRTEKASDKMFQELYEKELNRLIPLYNQYKENSAKCRQSPFSENDEYRHWDEKARDIYWKIWELDIIFPTEEEWQEQNTVNEEDLADLI